MYAKDIICFHNAEPETPELRNFVQGYRHLGSNRCGPVIPIWNHDPVKNSSNLINIHVLIHTMSEYDGYGAKYTLIRTGIGKILDSLDTRALEEIDKKIEELDIDIDYLCEYPDVLCSILKIACGKSYVDVIRAVSE